MLLASALIVGGLFTQPQARPNIVFIFTDDHASHAIGAYGSVINETPNIDRLAAAGMLFENCFVTNSICAPSRAVILTGKHSHLNGVRDNGTTFDGEQQTFPKLLQQAGYETALIGKWHLRSTPTGFDYFDILPGQGSYYNPDFINADGRYRVTGYVTDIVTDKAIDWMSERRGDEPFMLMLQHKAPHRAWRPGPKYLNLYEGIDIPEPVDLFDDWSNRNSGAKTQEMSVRDHLQLAYDLKIGDAPERLNDEQKALWNAAYGPRNEWFANANLSGDDLVRYKYQRYIKDYLRCIQSVDDSVGRVLDYLEDAGLADHTIVVYASDQGFYLGDYGWYDKRWIYEPSLRTPLIVKWPGTTEPGARNEDIVLNLDFAQTFLDLAGAADPDGMQGASLMPLLRGERPGNWRRSMYYHYYEKGVHNVPRHYGARTDRFKIAYYYDLDEWELFDLQNDPREKNSVFDDPDYAAIRDGMLRLLEAERRAAGDVRVGSG
ncbi:MAG: sulfatase [Armatimonadetes bacterium]|nr:sulfatase [Armatimonadota bacterium]